MRLSTAVLAAAGAALLTGCGSLVDTLRETANYSDVERIDYNLYRLSGTRPGQNQQLQLREYLYMRAKNFCQQHADGAQLLDAVSGKNPAGEGVRAELIFRCVGEMKAPEQEFVDLSPEAEAQRREEESLARRRAEKAAEGKAEAEAEGADK